MKMWIVYLAFSTILLSACQKENNEGVLPIYNKLTGTYTGEVTYVGLDPSGKVDPDYPVETHAVHFEIENTAFNRPECGCKGSIAVDEEAGTAHFTSKNKECEDSGTSDGQTWSFTNDVMGKFTFRMTGDTLTLIGVPGGIKNAAHLQKTIVAIRGQP
jgi:hypothetical protein